MKELTITWENLIFLLMEEIELCIKKVIQKTELPQSEGSSRGMEKGSFHHLHP